MIYLISFVIAIAGCDLLDKGNYPWGAGLLAGAAVAALVAKYIDQKYPDE